MEPLKKGCHHYFYLMCFNIFTLYIWLIVKYNLLKTLAYLSSLHYQLQTNQCRKLVLTILWEGQKGVFDTNENIKKEILKYLNVKRINKRKQINMTLEANFWVTNIDEYLWMIYDTTDMEKLDSHIEDTKTLTELNLKVIIIVRVLNGFNLEFED